MSLLRLSRCLWTHLHTFRITSGVLLQFKRTNKEHSETRIKKIVDKSSLNRVDVWPGMSVVELAKAVNRKTYDVLTVIRNLRHESTIRKHDFIDDTTLLAKVVKMCNCIPQFISKKEEKPKDDKDLYPSPPAPTEECHPRPPVVTIMGHVDHGKTTLLDALRNSHVVDQEFGGITQHIGAFSVRLPHHALSVTFLDTPGHAAFASMRSRGAHCTDIVVLVVAADDGVMDQTLESIRYAKSAKVPIVVAINKMDKHGANPKRVLDALSAYGVVAEELGGEVQAVPISALKRTNLDRLQEAIITQAELMELRATDTGPVHAVVIEASTEHGLGKVTTLLIERGTLRQGDILVAGLSLCRVRLLHSNRGEVIKSAGPGTPVKVSGWQDIPSAGDIVLQPTSHQHAMEVIRYRRRKMLESKAVEDLEVYTERTAEYRREYNAYIKRRNETALSRRAKIRMTRERPVMTGFVEDTTIPRFSLLVKGDVDGSVEAILEMMDAYQLNDVCKLDILHFGVGPPTLTDLEMAENAGGVIYLFNVEATRAIETQAKERGVAITYHNVIYHLADDIKERIRERLPLLEEEEVSGEARVEKLFRITENRSKVLVAGCRCTSGTLSRHKLFRVLRFTHTPSPVDEDEEEDPSGEVVASEVRCISLKHLTNDVETIRRDVECGLRLDLPPPSSSDDDVLKPGDVIVCYEKKKKPQTDWDLGF